MLTETKIKSLRPTATRYLVSDGSGLNLEVRPNATCSWVYRYRARGRAEKVVLGKYPAMGLKEARNERNRLAVLVAQGKSLAEIRRQEKIGLATEPTVREFGERYLKEYIEKKYKDPTNTRRYFEKEIYPRLGNKKLREVTAIDVQRIAYFKRDHGFPSAGIALRNLLKRMFDYAVEKRLVEVNPAAQVARRFIGTARRRSRALTAAEIREYLRGIYESNMRRQFKLAHHLILLTMVRKSELLEARWKDVNLELGEWRIPAAHTKTGELHIVYLSTQAVALFQELKKLAGDSELVLPGRGSTTKPFAKNALNKSLEGITFEMDAFTIHDMRRTASTILHGNGWPSDAIELALGHQIGGVRGVYNVADYADQRKKMLQWWGDCVHGLMNESRSSSAISHPPHTTEMRTNSESFTTPSTRLIEA